MTWFLVILFLTANGEGLELKEGWYPLQMPNEYVCGESVKRVIAYLSSVEIDAVAYCQLSDAVNPEFLSYVEERSA